MLWLLVILGTIFVVELFVFLPLDKTAEKLFVTVYKSGHTITSQHISDHWKEKVIPAYARQLFINSITLFIFVILAISPMVILGFIGNFISINFFTFLSTLIGILITTGLAFSYIIIRTLFIRLQFFIKQRL